MPQGRAATNMGRVEALLFPAVSISTALVVALLNHLASGPWRRSKDQHWTERARVLWPARTTAMSHIFLLPGLAVCAWVILRPIPLSQLPAVYLASWLGAILGTWPLDRAMFPQLTFRFWLHEVAVAWVLRFGMILVWLAAMLFMPLDWGWPMAYLVAGVLALHLAWTRLATLLLRLAGVLTRPDDRLARIVAEASQRAGVPVSAVWVAGGAAVNAFALPLAGELIFTRRLLEELDEEELSAICAHELGHLSESRGVRALRLLASMAFFPLLLLRPVIEHAGLNGLVLVALASLLLKRLALRTAHGMEKRADGIASQSEAVPGVYARALEKIYQGNHLPAVMPGKGRPHPHLFDRMTDAGVEPGFPRPLPPARRCWHAWLLMALLPVMAGWAAHEHLGRTREAPRPGAELRRSKEGRHPRHHGGQRIDPARPRPTAPGAATSPPPAAGATA